MGRVLYTATLTLLGSVGSLSPSPHCLTAREREQWAAYVLQHTTSVMGSIDLLQNKTASLLGSRGQGISFAAVPHCWGVVGIGSPSIHHLIPWERSIVEVLQHTGTNGE